MMNNELIQVKAGKSAWDNLFSTGTSIKSSSKTSSFFDTFASSCSSVESDVVSALDSFSDAIRSNAGQTEKYSFSEEFKSSSHRDKQVEKRDSAAEKADKIKKNTSDTKTECNEKNEVKEESSAERKEKTARKDEKKEKEPENGEKTKNGEKAGTEEAAENAQAEKTPKDEKNTGNKNKNTASLKKASNDVGTKLKTAEKNSEGTGKKEEVKNTESEKSEKPENTKLPENFSKLESNAEKTGDKAKTVQSQASKESKTDKPVTKSEEWSARLEKETGVKIKRISFEKEFGKNDDSTDLSGKKESGSELLKSLELNSKDVRKLAEKLAERIGKTPENNIRTSDIKEKVFDAVGKAFKEGTSEAKTRVFNANMEAFKSVNLKNSSVSSATSQVDQLTPAFNAQKGTFSNAMAESTPQAAVANSNFNAVVFIQDLVSRMQSLMKSPEAAGGMKMSMDFEAKGFGQMQISMQEKGDSLSVTVNTGSQSSREHLMDHRDELAQQLREMGYKFVNLDIAGRNWDGNSHYQQQADRHFSGNEEAENVKLAGNDEEDLARILEMY